MTSGFKLTQEEVELYFLQHGCQVLEEYKNARTKIKYRCICGREAMIVFYSFKAGNRCRDCGNEKNSKKQTLQYETVVEKFNKIGCELISPYEKASKPIIYKCSCGEIATGTPNNIWKQGRCGKCGLKSRSGKNHYMWYDDRDEFKRMRSFKDRCHKLVTLVLREIGRVKNENTDKLLGYNYNQLKDHIQSHENWENLKNTKWHVDHIFPIKAFLDHGIFDLKIINCLENLRPLDAKENCCKNSKYNKDEFYVWLKQKGVKWFIK